MVGDTSCAYYQLLVSRNQPINFGTLSAAIERNEFEEHQVRVTVTNIWERREKNKKVVVGRNYRRTKDSSSELEVKLELRQPAEQMEPSVFELMESLNMEDVES